MPSSRKPGRSIRSTVDKGSAHERLAAIFYEQLGFEIVARNWRAGRREIDLIARRDKLLVFVEVKSATTKAFGHPAEWVDDHKRAHLTAAARQFLIESEMEGCDVRFDVVTFTGGRLEHFPNAFETPE